VYVQNLGLNTFNENKEINPLASIIVAVLAEMANIERSNIQYRLNSNRQNFVEKGSKLGRKVGTIKTTEQMKDEYKVVISFLRRGYSVRNTTKLSNNSVSTVQRLKSHFCSFKNLRLKLHLKNRSTPPSTLFHNHHSITFNLEYLNHEGIYKLLNS